MEAFRADGTSPPRKTAGTNADDPRLWELNSDDTILRGRIVVVDDCLTNLLLLTRLLKREGHVVSTATDGDQALDLVTREQPDLVIMDVMMPGRDGLETCRLLKRQASTRLIPIVLVTALNDSHHQIRGLH